MEYDKLKNNWMQVIANGKVTDEIKMVTNMVRKDVLRTDRQHKFYSGENNENVTILYNILTTFALHHPSVGYCQVSNIFFYSEYFNGVVEFQFYSEASEIH